MSDTQSTTPPAPPPSPSRKLTRANRWANRLQLGAEACRAEAERCAYWALIFFGAAGVLTIKARAKQAEVDQLVADELAPRTADEAIRTWAHRPHHDVAPAGNGAGDQLVDQAGREASPRSSSGTTSGTTSTKPPS